MGNSKGSSFERDICRQLSEWWTNGQRDDVFWRTAGSGARATTRAKSGKKTTGSYGDITCIDPAGADFIRIVTLELKRGYKDWSIQDALDKGKRTKASKFEEFWDQVVGDADEAGTEPMLISKKDKHQTCICMTTTMFQELVGQNGPFYSYGMHITIASPLNITMMLLESFLKWCKPETFLNL